MSRDSIARKLAREPPVPFAALPEEERLALASSDLLRDGRAGLELLETIDAAKMATFRIPGCQLTLLEMAARCGRADVTRLIVRRCPALVTTGGPVAWAASSGQLGIMRELIHAGANPATEKMHDGETALHHAAENGQLGAVQYLIEELGMSPLTLDEHGYDVVCILPTGMVETLASSLDITTALYVIELFSTPRSHQPLAA